MPSEDLCPAMARLLAAMGEIGKKHMNDEIDIRLHLEQYLTTWSKAREPTSSSPSKAHFRHYIAIACSKLLTKGMAMKITLHALLGYPPNRWYNASQMQKNTPPVGKPL